ncbi:protein of unknown function [Methylorubrum extorquens DM4]|uniref:Helix-turn-helix domain-containing protein n=1 Tax=Methylorubrum extorquens (strain DSM 6343 / CIP 106787 / DM4) TaxID=661410 RepID=C7CFB1_METED|nr:protein of unknown function [Methylorubrum extorquens DM4]
MPTLTNKEAAARLGVSPSFLNKERMAGNGPVAYRYGRRKVVFLASDVAAYAAAHRQEPSAQHTAGSSQDKGVKGGPILGRRGGVKPGHGLRTA